jgi:hypothetical protein
VETSLVATLCGVEGRLAAVLQPITNSKVKDVREEVEVEMPSPQVFSFFIWKSGIYQLLP